MGTAPTTTQDDFIIGVFMDDEVPIDGAGHNACQTWKARGINTAFLVPQGHDAAGWDYRNTDAGLRVVRSYANRVATNTGPMGLLGIASDVCPDEPDEHSANVDALVSEAAALRVAHPGIPLYQSVSGGKILGMEGATFSDADYTRLLAAYDWVATDIYPVTGWGLPNKLSLTYDAQVRLAALAPKAAKRFAFIECSNQRLSWVPSDATDAGAPTATQMWAEVFLSLMSGVHGIIYFAESIGQWAFDATNADEQNAMTQLNSWLAVHSDFWMKGTRTSVTVIGSVYTCSWTFAGNVLSMKVDLSATATSPVILWGVAPAGQVAGSSGSSGSTTSQTPSPLATSLDGAIVTLKTGERLAITLLR